MCNSYILKENPIKLCMLAYCHYENRILVQPFDWTICEEIIVCFDIKIFHGIWGGGGGRRPMFFCQKTFNYICLCCSFMSITHVEYVLIWLFKYITDVYIIDFPYSISCTITFLVPYLENIQSSKIYKRFSYCDFCISIFQFRKQKLRLRDLQEKEEDQKWKNLPPRERMRIRKQQQADQEAERLR